MLEASWILRFANCEHRKFAVSPVILILLSFPPEHLSDFKCSVFVGKTLIKKDQTRPRCRCPPTCTETEESVEWFRTKRLPFRSGRIYFHQLSF